MEALYASGGRYHAGAKNAVKVRVNAAAADDNIPFAAYVHPNSPDSGAYSGLSFVVFPSPGRPAVFGLVVGTHGLHPDEAILGRPGHARKARAICAWLNRVRPDSAWARHDPTRTDIEMPAKARWDGHEKALGRYSKEVYALFCPDDNRAHTTAALTAFLDLHFEERECKLLKAHEAESQDVRNKWFAELLPTVAQKDVHELLADRRYVILQGPPGTGKTKMATDLVEGRYKGRSKSIQFHPNTTYETFVGGLAPATAASELGLRFAPVPGVLMQAAALALQQPDQPYLLHIDEINRADLGKVLGEAIMLLEPKAEPRRSVDLPYDFGPPFGNRLQLPQNLHILGTMNSSDRSIAPVDVAVRRRFAFLDLWPRISVVEALGCELTQEAYRRLLSHFVEHASDETFALLPGHSYFLQADPKLAARDLRVSLAPLLEEYLAQGYVSGFSEQIRSYLQWLRALSQA